MNTFVALCAVGAEKILGNEIKHLGYTLAGNAPGRVSFIGDDDALYRSNLCLRTSDRVYMQMARYKADTFDDLFEGCFRVDWQDFFRKDVRVVVDKVRVYKSRLNSEHTIQSMIQKAIYTKLSDVWRMSSLPESGAEADVRVYMERDEAVILLDTSGQPLHKRGYRTESVSAPLRETTAAVLLQEMLWRRKIPLHDPFCGSGTITVEAVLYAHNVAPGLGRNFAYENLPIYNEKRALDIKRKEAGKIRTDVECHISGSDVDSFAVECARKNAEHACSMAGRALQLIGSDMRIERPEFFVSDFSDVHPDRENGLVLCNPPYGERLGDEKHAESLYRSMDSLFLNFKGWQMGVITNCKSFEDFLGKKASAVKPLKAGNLDTSLYIYR
ncbi:THUMP domain-containing class I SAM-dependent RNA methyltransferase [Treponema sp.]|uniref:THUMP domain-containing class I SAM-dependent RNA methyltransferase n=1 Tax=Treponema sp. TaxID=166 RepID=UPI003F0AA912